MKSKTIGILAAITVVVILAAVILTRQKPDGIPRAGEPLFPELKARLNEVKDIIVSTKDQAVHVTREESGWVVTEKSGYRASMGQVRPVLIGLADLTILEPKTRNPDLYDKLGLQDVQAEGSSSTLVTLKDAEGKTLAELLMGNQRLSKGDSSKEEIYVRKPGDSQAWLCLGRVRMEKTSDGWIEKQVLNIDSHRVRQVRVVHPGGETVTLQKDKPTAPDFVLQHLPKTSKVASQYSVNNIADTIAQLTIDDVLPEAQAKVRGMGAVKATLETFDGLRVIVTTGKQDNTHYAKILSEFDQALVQHPEPPSEASEGGKETTAQQKEDTAQVPPSSRLKPVKDVQQEVQALNETVSGWVFTIPKFRVDALSKRNRELMSKDKKA